jgi:hypothetical protein
MIFGDRHVEKAISDGLRRLKEAVGLGHSDAAPAIGALNRVDDVTKTMTPVHGKGMRMEPQRTKTKLARQTQI